MAQGTVAQEYIDLMAEAFQVLALVSDYQLYLLGAASGKAGIETYVKSKFDDAQGQNVQVLLNIIQELLVEMMGKSEDDRYTFAVAICQCMDKKIWYADIATDPLLAWDGNKMNLDSLVPIRTAKQPIVISSLNRNYQKTKICIAPKFPVSGASMPGDSDGPSRRLSTRNALYGINGKLENVSYYPLTEDSPSVCHIILPEKLSQDEKKCIPEETRIVFSPLTDRQDLLKTGESTLQTINGISCNAITVDGITDSEYVEQHFMNSWLAACEWSPDIFFAPEMLATDKMVRVENGGSTFLKPLLKKAALDGWNAPRITVMPTYWKNGQNSLLVFDEIGNKLGIQYKQIPYVDEKNGQVEAIGAPPSTDVLIIHLENQQRIAFAICAEFLANPQFIRNFLCGKLGATLILVPSYTRGEQDFVDTLPILKPYGTSVIWGNCCGAVPTRDDKPVKRIIGGCNYAGIDGQGRFGSESLCQFQCSECKTCFFEISIPTDICWEKPDSPQAPKISHVYT